MEIKENISLNSLYVAVRDGVFLVLDLVPFWAFPYFGS